MPTKSIYLFAGIFGLVLLLLIFIHDFFQSQSIGIFLLVTSPGDLLIVGNDERTNQILKIFLRQRGALFYLFLYCVLYLSSCFIGWFSLLERFLFLQKCDKIQYNLSQTANFCLFQVIPVLSFLISIPNQLFHIHFVPFWLIVHYQFLIRIGLALMPFDVYGLSHSDQDNLTLFGFIISGLTSTIIWLHPLFDPIKIITVFISTIDMFFSGKWMSEDYDFSLDPNS